MADWQAGDLALCVAVAPEDAIEVLGLEKIGFGPVKGLTYTVTSVHGGVDCYGRQGLALQFAEIGRSIETAVGYNSLCFRKITPGTEIEGIEVERRVPVREAA
jgi:hypothetical protein